MTNREEGRLRVRDQLYPGFLILKYLREGSPAHLCKHSPGYSHIPTCSSICPPQVLLAMYSIRCSRCLGLSMVPTAIVSILANVLLLFPGLDYRYICDSHVTPEAVWCTGIWISGFVVLVAVRGFATRYIREGRCLFRADMLCRIAYACVAGLAAFCCFLVNCNGLTNGPLCLHNGTEGQQWSRPLSKTEIEEKSYLYEPERWASACLEPLGVVMWNIILFSTIMTASGLQIAISAVQILHTLLGAICGPGSSKTKDVPA
ncbi:transmembrane 4 L6 family member 19 [Brachyhypopomus gauderio]|uniref:transmembrane 4 L6 family member 19 n=1 Tax=Brachyhypopomus gauderio TaxID=698409 RepID=UPI00404180B5